MVADISIKDLKKKLNSIFCKENKNGHKYASVWLSDADFGGLYNSEKFVVNIKTEHQIDSCNDEIKYIITVLFKELNNVERSAIWRVDVYNSFEEIHCQSDDVLVYTEAGSCDPV